MIDLPSFCDLVATELGRAHVEPESHCIDDLGAESMDLVAILAAVEGPPGLAVDETELSGLTTVRDLYQRILAVAGNRRRAPPVRPRPPSRGWAVGRPRDGPLGLG